MFSLLLSRRMFDVMLLGSVISTGWSVGPALAQTDEQEASAESFVKTWAERVSAIVASPGFSPDTKRRLINWSIDELVDQRTLSRVVMGPYGRTLTPAEVTRFGVAFRAYAQDATWRWIEPRRGAKLRITGSTAQGPNEVIVHTEMAGGGAPEGGLPVEWRVVRRGGDWKLADVNYAGAWLSDTQRRRFLPALVEADGDVDVVIAQLYAVVDRRGPAGGAPASRG